LTKESRILFLGGKSFNIPRRRLTCPYEQYEQDRKGASIPNGESRPDVILVFKDFISHGMFNRLKDEAKAKGIPFIASSGGIGKLLAEAERRGIDMKEAISNTEPTEASVKETKEQEVTMDTTPSGISKDRTVAQVPGDWINNVPANAKTVSLNGILVYVIRKGSASHLLMRRNALALALTEVERAKMGKGPRGGINADEARSITHFMEKNLSLKANGIGLGDFSVKTNVNRFLGTLSPKQAESIATYRPRKKKDKTADSGKKPIDNNPAPTPSHRFPSLRETGTDQSSGVLSLEIFRENTRLNSKVVELTAENTFLSENLGIKEGEIKTLRGEIEALQKKITQLKNL
jgi:hypothetical protein